MKDSIQSAIAPSATGSGHIQAASRRVEAMGASLGNPVQPPTVFELEEALAERVQTCELLGRNWRNRVYPVQLATGDAALAKQVVMGSGSLIHKSAGQKRAHRGMNHHTDKRTNGDHASTACLRAARIKLGALFP